MHLAWFQVSLESVLTNHGSTALFACCLSSSLFCSMQAADHHGDPRGTGHLSCFAAAGAGWGYFILNLFLLLAVADALVATLAAMFAMRSNNWRTAGTSLNPLLPLQLCLTGHSLQCQRIYCLLLYCYIHALLTYSAPMSPFVADLPCVTGLSSHFSLACVACLRLSFLLPYCLSECLSE